MGRGFESLQARHRAPPRWLLAAIPAAFLLLEAWRSAPFEDDFATMLPGDDWYRYRVMAASVLHGGWTIPAVPGPYRRPGGFLYVYFVAGVMRVLGENSTAVYLVQSLLTGATAVVAYLAFRRVLSPAAGWVYLGGLTAVLYVDQFRHLTHRLLSENLLLPLLPAAVGLLLWTRARPSAGRGLATGLVLGAAILARPNVVLLLPLFAALLWWPRPRSTAARWAAAALVGASLAGLGVLVLRNYVVTGAPSLAVFTATRDWLLPEAAADAGVPERAWAAGVHYGRRVLFTLGVASVLVPEFRVRPHWLVLWAGVLIFTLQSRRRRLAFWEVVVVLSLLAYLVPLLAVAHIQNYGGRMLVPGLFLVLVLAVRAGELAWGAKVPSASAPTGDSGGDV